jgi:predicted transcriptional regulator
MPKNDEKAVNFSLRLSPALDRKVQEFADKNHWSRNKAIVLILEKRLAETKSE